MSAPHLPPQTSSIAWRARLIFARTLVIVLVIALAAGAAAALVVLAWYPEIIGTGRESALSPTGGVTRPPSFDAGTLTQTIERGTVGIYRAGDSVRRFNVTFYPREAAVGWGVFLTDDGWLLTTKEVTRAASDLRVIDARGTVYPIDRIAHDPVTGLSFVKIAGDGFTEVPVAERDPVSTGTALYSIDGVSSLVSFTVGSPDYNRSEPLVTGELARLLRLEGARVPEGAPLFNAQGFLVGSAHHRNAQVAGATVIIPAVAARSIFDRVFSGSALPATAVRITYLMIPDVIPSDVAKDRKAPRLGAYVLRVQRTSTYRGPLPTLAERDIITAVNDEAVTTQETLAFLLARLRPAKDALFTVYRAGEYLRIPVVLGE